MILECVSLKKVDEDTHDVIMNAVFSDERLPVEHFKSCLATRKRQEDVFMFWAMLTSSKISEGLVDILKLDMETGSAIKFGTMTDIVEKPGFQLGSAACYLGPYVYISGGGPDFGKVNWIRQIWRFDVSKPYAPWETVGDLIEFRRNHTMVILNWKLYIFGGFGKFRTKNVQMHSLDLNSGDWEQLAPMPVHEFNPPATTANTCIYYISSHWTLHCFSLETKDWTHLDFLTPPEPAHPEIRPLTLFPFKAGESRCFAIATLFRDTLKIQLLRAHAPSLTLQTFREVADMPIYFTFANFVTLNGKLVLFFTSQKSDDPFSGQNESSAAFLNAWGFDPMTNQYSCFSDIHNVRQALSIAALPYFPDVFSLECKELL
ncbi:unnamed protein product [Candidula unifasciata]|uniref:Uncharacterized protein n=1 Tax=Candidula unifasciata TaxID=100452 RepID=A0A8S3YRZ6_9EUPU|nr:unnamed protein product [Candidula unifasciata]